MAFAQMQKHVLLLYDLSLWQYRCLYWSVKFRMIRRILSPLSKGVTSSLISKSCQSRNKLTLISAPITSQKKANFTSLILGSANANQFPSQCITKPIGPAFLGPKRPLLEQIRTVIKFSYKKGKRKSVKNVPARFFRLHWGIWIRTMAGRGVLWHKKTRRRNRLQRHVFCNATQSYMLDKMVNRFWRKPKYYIDDPYAVYHNRENFDVTRRKPWRPEGVDYE